MWIIYRHQLFDNLKSLRFQVSLGILLLFFVGNGTIYTMKIERLNAEDRAIEAEFRRAYDEVSTVAQAADQWYRILDQERGTEFIAEAGFNWLTSALWVNPRLGNATWPTGMRTTNNWMRRFEVLDWTLIARYVLSFLCVVLAYNAVSGELETGTLRLALANPVARGAFLMGKFLAHLTTLTTSLLLGCLVSLAILVFGGLVSLDAALCRSVALYIAAAMAFTSLFLLLSMGVSILARSSASALVFLVTAWTLTIVVIPQGSYLVATQSVPSTGRYWQPINQLERDARESMEREGTAPRDPERAARDGYAVEQRFVQRMAEVDDEMNRRLRAVEQQQQRQFGVARAVNLLSPGYAFQYAVEAGLGAGVPRVQHFLDEGSRYRRHLQDFLRERDADDPDSPHVLFLRDFMSQRELDTAHIPHFQATPLPADVRLQAAVIPAVTLLLETALAFFFALWAINRADLTGGGG